MALTFRVYKKTKQKKTEKTYSRIKATGWNTKNRKAFLVPVFLLNPIKNNKLNF